MISTIGLIERFRKVKIEYTYVDCEDPMEDIYDSKKLSFEEAKQCALIAIDVLIEACPPEMEHGLNEFKKELEQRSER